MKLSGHDQAVMATSNDALVTKVYASQLGYFMDNHAKLFLKNKRKLYPIINRGTWARVQAYRQVILSFVNAFCPLGNVNIISLGAGYDTNAFWLHEVNNGQLADWAKNNITYTEVDFDQVVNRKIEII